MTDIQNGHDKKRIAERIIRAYNRRGDHLDHPVVNDEEVVQVEEENDNPPNDVDELASDMCDELINQLRSEASYTNIKAIGFKCIDNTLYIGSHLISLTIMILGLYGGVSTVNNNDSSAKGWWFFVSGVLGGVNGIITEVSKRYNFKARSDVIYQCSQEYGDIISTLRMLKVDPSTGQQKLVKLNEIEHNINAIQMKCFDTQVIKTTPPTNITIKS